MECADHDGHNHSRQCIVQSLRGSLLGKSTFDAAEQRPEPRLFRLGGLGGILELLMQFDELDTYKLLKNPLPT
jgi:hypothetical protein